MTEEPPVTEQRRFGFRTIALPGGDRVDLALPRESSDPVVQAYAEGRMLNSYLTELLLRFTQPRDYVMDLGCHVVRSRSLAAALGRFVYAVDASPLHVDAVRESADRNILDTLRVEWCAIARNEGEMFFDENGLWGMVSTAVRPNDQALRVQARRVDDLLRNAGWPRVDLIKMDVEGSEMAALESLGGYLAREDAPVIVYESNGMTFDLFGYTIADIRMYLERAGYVTCRVEGTHLVYCPSAELQPEAWLDVVALPPRWQKRERVFSSWDREAMIARCVEWGKNEHENVRQYVLRALRSDATYPRDNNRINALRLTLEREFGPAST